MLEQYGLFAFSDFLGHVNALRVNTLDGERFATSNGKPTDRNSAHAVHVPWAGSKIMVGADMEDAGRADPFTAWISTLIEKGSCTSNTSSGEMCASCRTSVMSYL